MNPCIASTIAAAAAAAELGTAASDVVAPQTQIERRGSTAMNQTTWPHGHELSAHV